MTNITIYDEDDERLDAIYELYGLMPHEILQILLDECEGEWDRYFT